MSHREVKKERLRHGRWNDRILYKISEVEKKVKESQYLNNGLKISKLDSGSRMRVSEIIVFKAMPTVLAIVVCCKNEPKRAMA